MKRVIITILILWISSYIIVYTFVDSINVNEDTLIILLFLSIIVYLSYYFLIKVIVPLIGDGITSLMFKEVKKASKNYQEIIKLNENYNFEPIENNKISILNREYSLKSYDRDQFDEVLRYNIENNINDIRLAIEKAIRNEKLYSLYTAQLSKINYDLDEELIEKKAGMSKKTFIKLEQKLINKVKISNKVYDINCEIEIYYSSPKGYNTYSKKKIMSYEQLVAMYHIWLNGKKYEVTSKIERHIMNEDIRYNVLKRDNFTCVLCGATAKDGAKLQVDHIIPVSKGGKTIMSNLQTLCERCNKGKNNKINDDDICPVCGGALIEKKGKYGVFIGCSNYPKCYYTKEK